MKLVPTTFGFNIRSRQLEAWSATTEDGRYSAYRIEEPGTPWVVRFKDVVIGEVGSLKKAQALIETHASGKYPHCFKIAPDAVA